jgi:hypothetical protein
MQSSLIVSRTMQGGYLHPNTTILLLSDLRPSEKGLLLSTIEDMTNPSLDLIFILSKNSSKLVQLDKKWVDFINHLK